MRILVLQFVPDTRGRPVPRFQPQLGTLLALLEARGHTLDLAGFARFDLARIKAAVTRALPQLVYADISAVCVDAARRTLEHIDRHEFVPIVAGGEYPSVDPDGCLSLPGVHAAVLGEPDASLVTYFERIKDPAVGQLVSGVWLRDERGTARPEMPWLVEDLDSLPWPSRDPFNCATHVRTTGQIELATGRGNPEPCTYWNTDRVAALYEGRGSWVRRRSAQNVLDEIERLRSQHSGVQRIRFLDVGFAADAEWLSDFLPRYRDAVTLPFRCHLRANSVYHDLPRAIADAGGAVVDVDVISGSDFLRNEIFEMQLGEPQIRDTFAGLRDAGLRTRAVVFAGAPYESEASLEETRGLLQRIRPDIVDVRPYYPWPGSRARDLCVEQGWLHSRGEEQYHRDRCGIDMPACRPDIVDRFVRRLRAEMPGEPDQPWWRRWSLASRSALEAMFTRRPR
jgi:anaerobic magnesium-protoporphyrin IX monomethyl ester cyclase